MSTDRYDSDITINDEPYRVSFLPSFQRIVFTNLRTMKGGDFLVQGGWVAAKKPADFILIAEIQHHMKG